MGHVFSASPGDIQKAARVQEEIMDIVHNFVRDFHAAVAATDEWPGDNKDMRERADKERRGTEETATSLMDAVGGTAKVLNVQGNVIQGAQNDAFEAIDNQASKTGRH